MRVQPTACHGEGVAFSLGQGISVSGTGPERLSHGDEARGWCMALQSEQHWLGRGSILQGQRQREDWLHPGDRDGAQETQAGKELGGQSSSNQLPAPGKGLHETQTGQQGPSICLAPRGESCQRARGQGWGVCRSVSSTARSPWPAVTEHLPLSHLPGCMCSVHGDIRGAGAPLEGPWSLPAWACEEVAPVALTTRLLEEGTCAL